MDTPAEPNKYTEQFHKAGLHGRVALVTGASGGIGRATCVALAEYGAVVAVHFCSRESIALKLVSSIQGAGGQAQAFQADLTKSQDIDAMLQTIQHQLGSIEVLINNAGEMSDAPVEQMTDQAWELSLSINLSAAFRCSRGVISGMKQRRWGRIINVSSQAAFRGSAMHASYAASKAGLHGFTYSLAKELGAYGISVNAVAPGRIETELLMSRAAGREEEWLKQTPLGRFGLPEEVAQAIVFLASEKASYITGIVLNVDGGLVMG